VKIAKDGNSGHKIVVGQTKVVVVHVGFTERLSSGSCGFVDRTSQLIGKITRNNNANPYFPVQ
jgi:hypothetical protein